MPVEVIVNPRAARHRRDPGLIDDYRALGADRVRVHLSSSLDHLQTIVREIAARRPPVVAISGGDGTISLSLTALIDALGERPLMPIAPLMAGTMNMLGHSIGGRSNPLRELRRVAESPPEALLRLDRDTLWADGRMGFIFGFGLVTNFLEVYYDGPVQGPRKAAEVTARAVLATIKRGPMLEQFYRRQHGALSLDGEAAVDGAWTAALVQTIENLGIGFRPCYQALREPGTCHVIATQMSPAGLANHLPHIFRGLPWPQDRAVDRLARQLRFEPPTGDWLYTLDGELYRHEGPLEVRVGPTVGFVRAP